jgi:hypothetical protein
MQNGLKTIMNKHRSKSARPFANRSKQWTSNGARPDDDKIVGAVMHEIDAIVGRYGGACCECGPIPSDYVPFEGIFEQRKYRIN